MLHLKKFKCFCRLIKSSNQQTLNHISTKDERKHKRALLKELNQLENKKCTTN